LVSLKRSRRQWSNDIKKVTNSERSGSHEPSKGVRAHFFCAACVAYSGHRWWPFLVSLNSFRQDFFNNTSGVIIKVSMWLRVFLFLFFFFSLSPLSLNIVFIKFAIWKSGHNIFDSQITCIIYNSLNCIIFLNIFCTVLFYYYYFYYTIVQKHSTLEAQYHAIPFLFTSVLIYMGQWTWIWNF
jgi:hypothetical protein